MRDFGHTQRQFVKFYYGLFPLPTENGKEHEILRQHIADDAVTSKASRFARIAHVISQPPLLAVSHHLEPRM